MYCQSYRLRAMFPSAFGSRFSLRDPVRQLKAKPGDVAEEQPLSAKNPPRLVSVA